jgi:hypothetical protein
MCHIGVTAVSSRFGGAIFFLCGGFNQKSDDKGSTSFQSNEGFPKRMENVSKYQNGTLHELYTKMPVLGFMLLDVKPDGIDGLTEKSPGDHEEDDGMC